MTDDEEPHIPAEFIYLPICGVLLVLVSLLACLSRYRKLTKDCDEANGKYHPSASRSQEGTRIIFRTDCAKDDAAVETSLPKHKLRLNTGASTETADSNDYARCVSKPSRQQSFSQMESALKSLSATAHATFCSVDLEAPDERYNPAGFSKTQRFEHIPLANSVAEMSAKDLTDDLGCGVLAFLENVTPRISTSGSSVEEDNSNTGGMKMNDFDSSIAEATLTEYAANQSGMKAGWVHRIQSLHLKLDHERTNQIKNDPHRNKKCVDGRHRNAEAPSFQHCSSQSVVLQDSCVAQPTNSLDTKSVKISKVEPAPMAPKRASGINRVSTSTSAINRARASMAHVEECTKPVPENMFLHPFIEGDGKEGLRHTHALVAQSSPSSQTSNLEGKTSSGDPEQYNSRAGSSGSHNDRLCKWSAPNMGEVSAEGAEAHVPALPHGECGIPSSKGRRMKSPSKIRHQIKLR